MIQSSFNQKNTLKTTVQARARAKRRLLGSIALLLLALLILFKVSNNIESIPIDSDIIEVKNTNPNAQPTLAPVIAPDTTVASNSTPMVDKPQSSSTIASINNVASAPVAMNTAESTASEMMTLADLKPRITVDEIKSKPSPEDILDGNTEPTVIKRYYLQLIGLEDKEQIIHLKALLAEHGYTPSIQTIITPTTKVYRLRMGPYDSQSEVDSYFSAIKDVMQQ